MKCTYQATKVRGRAFVCYGYQFCPCFSGFSIWFWICFESVVFVFFILLLRIKPTRMAALILSKSVRILHIMNNGSIENQNKITESNQYDTVQKPNNLSRTFKHWIFLINIIYEEIYIKTGFFIGRSVHFFSFYFKLLKGNFILFWIFQNKNILYNYISSVIYVQNINKIVSF